MKYTIEGFSQEAALSFVDFIETTLYRDKKKITKKKEIRMDITDLAILRWLVDFYPRMPKTNFEGSEYVWINYSTLLKDMPLIAIGKQALADRLDKLVHFKILKSKLIKQMGNFTYFGFDENYSKLVNSETQKVKYSTTDPSVVNYDTSSSQLQDPSVVNYDTNTLLLKDTSINSSIKQNKEKIKKEIFVSGNFNIDEEEKPRLMNDRTWELFKEWWKLSRKQHKLANTKRAFDVQIKKMHLSIDVCNDNQYEIVEFSMNYNKDKTFQNICLPNKYQEKVDNVNELLNSMSEWAPKL